MKEELDAISVFIWAVILLVILPLVISMTIAAPAIMLPLLVIGGLFYWSEIHGN